MLKRLKKVGSTYSAEKWEIDRRYAEDQMERYTKYPHIFKVDEILQN